MKNNFRNFSITTKFTMDEVEKKAQFYKDLQEYWQDKNLTPLKNPQIGGRELEFYTFYNAVCQRGGAENVSSQKLWKEVVKELKLPSSCTSASYTLKNHYGKYLLGFELKYMQGKDDKNLPTLEPGRDHTKRINNPGSSQISVRKPNNLQSNNNNQMEEESESDSESETSQQQQQQDLRQDGKGKILHPSQVNPQNSQVGQELSKVYSKNDKKEEIHFIKKIKMFPTKSDMKRITLAFESRMQDEMTYALNSLLLYSVNIQEPLVFVNTPQLLENITKYLEDSIKNIPCLNKVYSIKGYNKKVNQDGQSYKDIKNNINNNNNLLIKQLNVLENYNYPVSEIILFNLKQEVEVSPLALLQKKKRENIQQFYDQIGEVQLLEQVRTIFQILRNMGYQKPNEQSIARNEKLSQLIFQLFLLNADQEISRNILDIIANISKHIQLQLIQDYPLFCDRIYEILQAETNEDLEGGVETLRNLISIQENETILENNLHKYLDSLTRLLLYSHGDIREGILEFLCYLSDLRMSTKIALAKQPKMIMRLIGLLGSGVGKQHEKVTKMSALTLNNIAMAPASRQFLKPYEKDLFIVAASDDSISKLLGDILSQLNSYDMDDNLI